MPTLEEPVREYLLPVSPTHRDEDELHIKARRLIDNLRIALRLQHPRDLKLNRFISEPGILFVYNLFTSFVIFASVVLCLLAVSFAVQKLGVPFPPWLEKTLRYIFLADLGLLLSSILRSTVGMLRDI